MLAQVAFYKGRKKVFNRLVAWWTKGKYSHCEFIEGYREDGSAICWSSSFSDGGVRKKYITLDDSLWDVVDITLTEEEYKYALAWFHQNNNKSYDILGLFGFVFDASEDSPDKWFCSEAVASALQMKESWRFSPNDLYALLA